MALPKIFRNIFDMKKGERVLIVSDQNKMNIANKIRDACISTTKNITTVFKPIGKYDGEEPPPKIAKLMRKFDIVIAPTTHSITHTEARIKASEKGARIATMPGVTESMLSSSLLADPVKLKEIGERLKRILSRGRTVKVKTSIGTNIEFSIENREPENDCADLSEKGSYGNLPAGEVSLSPVEGTANGVVAIDIMPRYAKSKTKIYVKDGFVRDISDLDSSLSWIFRRVKNSRNIAELGIGTNEKAKIIWNVLQDEKALGTCHIAFGNNRSYGGRIYSKVHLDTVLRKPIIEVDGKILMKDGKFVSEGNDRILSYLKSH